MGENSGEGVQPVEVIEAAHQAAEHAVTEQPAEKTEKPAAPTHLDKMEESRKMNLQIAKDQLARTQAILEAHGISGDAAELVETEEGGMVSIVIKERLPEDKLKALAKEGICFT